ncbi:MAG: hypothetical protein WCG83_01820 [Candidatus Peregrinibacteria bacterium]
MSKSDNDPSDDLQPFTPTIDSLLIVQSVEGGRLQGLIEALRDELYGTFFLASTPESVRVFTNMNEYAPELVLVDTEVDGSDGKKLDRQQVLDLITALAEKCEMVLALYGSDSEDAPSAFALAEAGADCTVDVRQSKWLDEVLKKLREWSGKLLSVNGGGDSR